MEGSDNQFDMDERGSRPVTYICANCGRDNELKADDLVRCKHCSYRVLYKKRDRELMQYEAR